MSKKFTCPNCGHKSTVDAAPVEIHVSELVKSDIGAKVTYGFQTGVILRDFNLSPKNEQDGVIATISVHDPRADVMREPSNWISYIREPESRITVWR